MKDSKYFNLMLFSLGIFLILGISYAYFSTNIIGNETAKKQTVMTGDLELTFTDTTEVSLDNAFPGDSFTKTISVKNTGTLNASYNLVWTELTNEIINDELVIEATCKRLNSSNTEEGTCESISQTPIKLNTIKKNISIEPSVTHEYTVKVTFIDTGSLQDYNKKKSFNGKLGIEEYKYVPFSDDAWSNIVNNVKNGNTEQYNLGDTRIINMGDYGTHVLRVANKSTPSECSTSGFSQTACGFVLEFADIITTHAMNDTYTNEGGWPASSMNTFVNNDIYNSLPSELKNAIIDTTVVSGHGSTSGEANFTSTDKLYLLSTAEVWAQGSSNTISDDDDTARDNTRQLDYYKNLGTSTSNYSGAIKKNGTSAGIWWLRSADSHTYSAFLPVNSNGNWTSDLAHITWGVSPAFRIG